MDTRAFYRSIYGRLNKNEIDKQLIHDIKWLTLIHQEEQKSIVKEIAEEYLNGRN